MYRQLAALEHAIELVAEDRQDHFAPTGVRGPIDVEPARVAGALPVREHVVPVRILDAHPHVIGDDVDDETHVLCVKLPRQGANVGLGPELGIDSRRIDDVVAVRAAGPRGENRRTIKM
jgi:hypothetical protein